MSLDQTIATIAQRMHDKPHLTQDRDAIKVSLVMPLLMGMGYDVFDPDQIVAGHHVDDNRVDFATYGSDGTQQMLIAVTSTPADIEGEQGRHLANALSADGQIGVLTDGDVYRFHMVDEGVMEAQPFLSLSLRNGVPDVEPLTLLGFHGFDAAGSRNSAFTRLLPASAYAALLDELMRTEGETLDLLANRISPDHVANDATREAVRQAMARALRILSGEEVVATAVVTPEQTEEEDDASRIMSGDEQAAFAAIQDICGRYMEPGRIHARLAQAYTSCLLDDNNRKYICRLYFSTSSTRYIGTFVGRTETKHRITSFADVENFVEQIENRLRELDPGTFIGIDAQRRNAPAVTSTEAAASTAYVRDETEGARAGDEGAERNAVDAAADDARGDGAVVADRQSAQDVSDAGADDATGREDRAEGGEGTSEVDRGESGADADADANGRADDAGSKSPELDMDRAPFDN